MDRSTTPPPILYPLTPPPTAGVEKEYSFSNPKLDNTISRRWNKAKEGESLTSFFEEPEEGSEVDFAELSEEESGSLTNDTVPASPVSDISTSSKTSIAQKHNLFAALSTVVNAAVKYEHFPLLELPLSIRNKVYEHLLVVPALICVRQNHTAKHDENYAFLDTGTRELLPGVAYALAQLTVKGYKIRFSRFASTNVSILLASKEVHAEAKAILYGKNNFEIPRPSTELSPSTDFSIRLFPTGCPRLITKLTIRIRSFYDLTQLLTSSYNDIKNFYRGLNTLTLILELDSTSKGFGKQWARDATENWQVYAKRLHTEVATLVFGAGTSKRNKAIPTWINLRVLFGGEAYDAKLNGGSTTVAEQAKRNDLRLALTEVWEMFKKGRR
jgi:hypothetical protein